MHACPCVRSVCAYARARCRLAPATGELECHYDFTFYEALRKRFAAEGALVDMRDKTAFYDAAAPELPKISLWRLHRAGLYEPMARALAAASVAALSVGAFVLWRRLSAIAAAAHRA